MSADSGTSPDVGFAGLARLASDISADLAGAGTALSAADEKRSQAPPLRVARPVPTPDVPAATGSNVSRAIAGGCAAANGRATREAAAAQASAARKVTEEQAHKNEEVRLARDFKLSSK